MEGRLLCVAAEIGAARYFEPLWKRWLSAAPGFQWRVVAGDGASSYLHKIGLAQALPGFAAASNDGDLPSIPAWKPTAVIASAGDHHRIELAAIRLARNLGAPSAQYVDTWYNYRRRFDHAGGVVFPDTILVIDDVARREAAAEGLPAERLHVVGQPAWEHRAPLRPAPKQHVLFLGAPVRRDYGSTLGFDETDAWNVVRAAATRAPDRFQRVIYGAHPAQDDLTEAGVSPFKITRNSMDALQECGTVVGIFSSPMIDAFLGGRTVVSVQPHMRGNALGPLSRHGYIRRVDAAEHLIEALGEVPNDADALSGQLRGSTERLDERIHRLMRTYK